MAVEDKRDTSQSIFGRKFTRRQIAKGLVGVGGVVATGVILPRVISDIGAKPKEYTRPLGLPIDVLTEEELGQAGISIHPTSEVQLYIRKGALEIPLFKDSVNHKINGLVISLVDHDRLSWNAVSRLPEEPRSVLQKFIANPKDWPEDYWQDLKRYENEMIRFHDQQKLNEEEDLAKIVSGKKERLIRENIEFYKSNKQKNETSKEYQGSLEYWQDVLKDLLSGEEEKRVRKNIKVEEARKREAEEGLRVLEGPRNEAEKYFAEYGVRAPQGIFIEPRPVRNNKAYIYLCVKGDYQPHPDQSYPAPQHFSKFTKKDTYTIHAKDILPGFHFRHELGHYEEKEDEENKAEEAANRIAYERLLEAWKYYQETGDDSGYPFVFVTKEGFTITRNLQTEENVASS